MYWLISVCIPIVKHQVKDHMLGTNLINKRRLVKIIISDRAYETEHEPF